MPFNDLQIVLCSVFLRVYRIVHRSMSIQVNIYVSEYPCPYNTMASLLWRRRRYSFVGHGWTIQSYAKKCAIFIYDLRSLPCRFMQICRFLPVLIDQLTSIAPVDSHLHARTILKGSLPATSLERVSPRPLHARSLTGNFRSRIRTLSLHQLINPQSVIAWCAG